MFQKIAEFFKKAIRFVTHDIWYLGSESLSKRNASLVRGLKIIVLSIRSFWEKSISTHASALTLYTIMSIVPVAALVFAVAKGFSIDTQLRTMLMESFPDQQEVAQWIITFADSALKNAKGGIIAGVGITMLLWAVISMLTNVENAFNHIWNVKTPRSWSRRFSNYLSMMIVVPIILVSASSLSVTLGYEMQSLEQSYPLLKTIGLLVKFIPFAMMWLMLAVVYMVMPNTRVRFKAAFIGGIVAGTAFLLTQNIYIYSQVSISKYSAIYGSFAAIPLFLLWAKISWLIILFGAELSFAFQNVDSYEHEKDSENMSMHERTLLALLVARTIAKNFADCEKALQAEEISVKSGIPVRAVRLVLDDLVDTEIVSEVLTMGNDKEIAYQPALDVHKLTVSYVQNRIDHLGSNVLTMPEGIHSDQLTQVLEQQASDFEVSEGNRLLINL